MKTTVKILAVIFLQLLNKSVFSQQLRLGNQPYGVEKSAVLELVSDNQGLLLPRISDTTAINSLNPPDGMVIYFTPNKRSLLRSNGYWKEMTVSGVTSVNGNSGALTMDTGYIANFYSKVRSLFSSSSPITLSNGQIGITQATTSTPGYLSSTDWNTFNNKLSSIDTSNISSFYLKVRSLHTVSSPLTYNSTTGAIGITQANTSTNGYLSSTDWDTFNDKQPAGNYITDPGGNGIVVRTSLNTSINRTLTGTTNRITVTNGNGVPGNPTIDINTSYAGQTSITTLGTIGTGTWNGTKISEAYGGTNQSTYTLGDLLYSSGANTLSKLAGTISTTKQFLSQTGNAVVSAAPSWSTVTKTDVGLANVENTAISSWTGSANIKTLGTITTGKWNGDIIPPTYGGTGVNNGVKTITLGNTLTTSGNFALTLTQTGVTNVTLPTSGTLATRAGTETFTNKTLTASSNSIGGVTMALGSDATGDIYYRNSSGILTRLPLGTSGQSLKVVSGLPAWANSATSYLPATAGSAGQQLRSDGTNYLNKTTTTYQATPADPSGTSSTTGVMMGLAGSITPGYSGKIMIVISGDIQNAVNNEGSNVQIRYGTGTAPSNGNALTGTATGAQIKMFTKNLTDFYPFSCNSIATGLTVGTAYWIDLSLSSTSGGTAIVYDISISIVEL